MKVDDLSHNRYEIKNIKNI